MKTTVVLYRQAAISKSKATNRSVRAESTRFHTKHSVEFHTCTCIHLQVYSVIYLTKTSVFREKSEK